MPSENMSYSSYFFLDLGGTVFRITNNNLKILSKHSFNGQWGKKKEYYYNLFRNYI